MSSTPVSNSASARIQALLSKITKGNNKAPWRVVIYGAKGTGKSTFASQCPGVVMVPIEEGTNQLRVDQLPQVKSWTELHEVIDAFHDGQHDYKAIALDGIDTAESLVVDHIESELAKGKREHILRSGKKAKSFSEMNEEYGSGYTAVVDEWRALISKLDKLRHDRGMRIFLVGHARSVRVENLEGKDFDRWELKALGKGTSALLTEWADFCLFARREVETMDMSRGKKVIGVTGKHVIQCRGTAAYDAKTRGDIPFPEKLPLDWATFEETARLIGEYGRGLPAKLRAEFDSEVTRIEDEERRKAASEVFDECEAKQDYAMQQACILRVREITKKSPSVSLATNKESNGSTEPSKSNHINQT